MFKKSLLVLSVLALTLVIFGAGFAFAQAQNVSAAGLAQAGVAFPGGMMGGRWNQQDGSYGPDMMGGRGGYGAIHDYVEQALGDKLGLTEAQVEEQLAAGKTMAQIALDNGVAEADLATFFTEIHTAAFDKAVADGVLTREQADLMLQNMSSVDWADGMPCLDGGVHPQDGTGFHGGMMGGRGNQPGGARVP